MRQENREKREAEIAVAAYKLLEEKGYPSVSMLMIARAAKASNETLYRWYGDKRGLFLALVTRNTDEIRRTFLELPPQPDLRTALSQIGPVLLGMVLGPRAIALNRAAAGDPSGALGDALAQAGRGVVGPMLADLFKGANVTDPRAATELYISLLIGDLQIRRVIGVLESPSEAEISARADRALTQFMALIEH